MAEYEYSKSHDDFQKLMRAYAGFQMATAIVVASKFGDVWCAWVIVSLFAISIPSALAYGSLIILTPDDEIRNPRKISNLCLVATFIPSITAISVLFAPASVLAAIAFPITCLAWYVTIVKLRMKRIELGETNKEVKTPNNHVE